MSQPVNQPPSDEPDSADATAVQQITPHPWSAMRLYVRRRLRRARRRPTDPLLRDVNEAARFSKNWRKRSFEPLPHTSWKFGMDKGSLELLVRRREHYLRREALGTHFRQVVAVSVVRRDGMSWSALAARRAITTESGKEWHLRCVSGSEDRRRSPQRELAALVGTERRVRRAARASGLMAPLRRDWSLWMTLAVAAVVLGGASVALPNIVARPGMQTSAAVAVSLAVALATLITSLLAAKIAVLPGPAAGNKLSEALDHDIAEDAVERAFIDGLRPYIRPRRRRRAFVIDRFDGLRPVTQHLIQAYLEEPGDPGEEELWVIFAQGQPRNAPSLVSLMKRTNAHIAFGHCRQRLLTTADKADLIRSIEQRRPSRADTRLKQQGIVDVIDRAGETEAAIATELSARLDRIDDGVHVVRGFALLALASTVTAPPELATKTLMKIASESGSRRSPLHELLVAWFPEESRNAVAISHALNRVAVELDELLDCARPGLRLRVAPAFADALVERDVWRSYELPSADHGHAFWALYWQRELESRWQATVAERLVAHLRALRDAVHIQQRHGARLATALHEAALTAIDASIALCIPGLTPEVNNTDGPTGSKAPGLLAQAHYLVPRRNGRADAPRQRQLVARAWTAHALTGDPAILETLSTFSLESRTSSCAKDPLAQLYFQRIAGPDGSPLDIEHGVLEADASLADHARVRGAWFAEIVRPITENPRDTLLHGAVRALPKDAIVSTDAVVKRLLRGGPATLAHALDYVTLIYAALHHALVRHRGGTVDGSSLAGLVEVASDLMARKPRRTHFVVEGLRWQLSAVAKVACSVLGSESDPESKARVAGAAAELDAVHVMWTNLEEAELANVTALARNTARLFATDPHVTAADAEVGAYLHGIGELGDGTLHRLEMELLVGTERRSYSRARAGVPLDAAAHTAIHGGLSEPITITLCEQILWSAPAPSPDPQREAILSYLANSAAGLAGILGIGGDDEVPYAARVMLGCITRDNVSLYEDVRTAAGERTKMMDDPWLVDVVQHEFEWFELHRDGPPVREADVVALALRWRKRHWPEGDVGREEQPSAFYKRRTASLYPWILLYMWPAVHRSRGAVLQDATRLVAEADLEGPNPGMVCLANSVVRELDATPGAEAGLLERALAVMHAGALNAEPVATPDMNARIFDRLAKDHPQYKARAVAWRAENERLKEERLVLHVFEGRFFEVFWHHFTNVLELPCDIPRDQLAATLTAARSMRVATLKAHGFEVPAAIMYDDRGLPQRLSGDFIRIGHYLLHASTDSDGPVLGNEDDRIAVDDMAQRHLSALYELLINHAEISGPLREIYRRQRDRFEEVQGI